VGTARRALAVEADGRFLVAPDNGVITLAWASAGERRAVEILDVEPPVPGGSDTFHGRDVFAPAAAHLSAGGALDGLGGPVADPLLTPIAEPVPSEEGLRGEVVHVDRFGNLVTNLPGSWGRAFATVEIAGRSLALSRSYGHAGEGQVLALVNSDGLVEVAVWDGSAAEVLSAGLGAPVLLRH
jgi:S-adenosylmethionine hydrolase